MWCGVVWCGSMWHGAACGVLCGVIWCGVVLCDVVLYVVTWCNVMLCGIMQCGVMSCCVAFCGVMQWGVIQCEIMQGGVTWSGVVWSGMGTGLVIEKLQDRTPPFLTSSHCSIWVVGTASCPIDQVSILHSVDLCMLSSRKSKMYLYPYRTLTCPTSLSSFFTLQRSWKSS